MLKIPKILILITILSLGVPGVVNAVTFSEYVRTLIEPLNVLVPILVGVAMIVFIWGVIQYLASSDPTKKEGSRRILVIGIVGIFILVSVWGIIAIVQNIFFDGVSGGAPFFVEPPRPDTNLRGIVPSPSSGTTVTSPPDGSVTNQNESPWCNLFPGVVQGCD